ncbi:MAG: dienelactone hydrolase [Verrucomicrobia bacterium]|nr:MAG: dienelactone hydrolase [Verrucomicrobiota bacterium]
MHKYRPSWLAAVVIAATGASGALADTNQTYDPLIVSAQFKAATLELVVSDATRQRDIPLRLYLPAEKKPAPVVLFSHGLGGSRNISPFLGEHWAARGYVAVFLQHPGSDTGVWQDTPLPQRMDAMREAASLSNFLLRVKDVSTTLDQLARWNKSRDHALAGRLDLQHIGMSGHSFGAVTTQAVSGQRAPVGKLTFTDTRIKAAIAFSPSRPVVGDPQHVFGNVAIPWLLMTGTKDVAPIGHADVPARLAVYPALPPGGKYEVVLDKAEHSAFTDRALPGDKEKRNPNHHRVMLALSTAFWDAYLRHDVAAQAWLDGEGPRTVLEPNDRWQHK